MEPFVRFRYGLNLGVCLWHMHRRRLRLEKVKLCIAGVARKGGVYDMIQEPYVLSYLGRFTRKLFCIHIHPYRRSRYVILAIQVR